MDDMKLNDQPHLEYHVDGTELQRTYISGSQKV
jgi:hypothetical protein